MVDTAYGTFSRPSVPLSVTGDSLVNGSSVSSSVYDDQKVITVAMSQEGQYEDNLVSPDPVWILYNITINITPPANQMDVVEPQIPTYIYLGVTIMYTLLFLVGIAGNALVIFVVWRNRDMRNSTNLFLTNLSISDLLVIIICMPSALLEFYSKDVWHLGDVMCE